MPALTFDDLVEQAPGGGVTTIPARDGRPTRVVMDMGTASQKSSGPLTFDDLMPESGLDKAGRYAEDFVRSTASGLDRGVAGLVGLPADIARGTVWLGNQLQSKAEGRPYEDVKAEFDQNYPSVRPALEEFGGAAIHNASPLKYQPKTLPGEAVEGIASFIPGGMIGRTANIGRNAVAYGLVPGLASEGAGQLTKGTPLEGPARVIGGIAGGLGSAGALRMGSADRLVQAAGKGVTGAELDAAEQLFQQARQHGVNISRAEALQSVTQGRTGMGDLQHTVEGMGGMRDFYAQRPAQNEAAARQAFDNVAPPAADPSRLGPAAGEGFEGVVRDAERARTSATSSYYRAAASDHVPTPEMQKFVDNLDQAIAADKTGIVGSKLREIRSLLVEAPAKPGTPAVPAQRAAKQTPNGQIFTTTPGTPAVPGEPERLITDIENLDRVRKYIRDRVGMPQIGAEAITKEQGATILQQLDDLKQRMLSASPDFAAGKALHQQITDQYLRPLMEGPIGRLASRDTKTRDAINALFPANPLPNSAQEIGQAVGALSARNPMVARQLVRTHAEMTFNEAAQRLAGGPNQSGGAKFAAILRGNPQQAANLEAAVRALPNGDQIWPGFNRFLEVMEAQQFRQATGSRTAFKGPAVDQLKGGGLIRSGVEAVGTAGFSIPKKVMKKFDDWSVGRNLDQLADVLTNPNAAATFRQLATAPRGSVKAAALATRLGYLSLNGPRKN